MRQENWEVYPTTVIPSPVIAKTVSFSGSRGESIFFEKTGKLIGLKDSLTAGIVLEKKPINRD